jgi:hypothetical protein
VMLASVKRLEYGKGTILLRVPLSQQVLALIYAGTWMIVAPSRALMVVKSFSITLSRFEGTSELPGIHTIRESTQVRVAFRLLGLVGQFCLGSAVLRSGAAWPRSVRE